MPARPRARTHYQALGVPRDAGTEEIQKAYRALARRLHPDAGAEADEKRFIEITRAYEVLSDAAQRRDYDAVLDGVSPSGEGTGPTGTPHYTWANVAGKPPKQPAKPSRAELDDLYDTFFGGGGG